MDGRRDRETPVAVIGCGVIGLTTAVSLLERGIGCVVYAERRGNSIASAAAPAVFTPFVGADPARLEHWINVSFARYVELSKTEPQASGVRLTELREYLYKSSRATPSGRLLQERPIIPRPAGLAAAWSTQRPHVLTARFLPWLEARVTRLGGRIISRRIEHPSALLAGDETPFRIAVNCAGIAAKAMTGDDLLRPIAGQVLHVPNTIGLTYSLHDDAPQGGVAYVFVYDDRLVLGSTNIEGAWNADVDPEAELAMVERCRGLLKLDGHPRWNELARGTDPGRAAIARFAGLRPARGVPGISEDPRVEFEQHSPGRGIYHHYGHGRSGVTLAWGTSAEVAVDIERLLAT